LDELRDELRNGLSRELPRNDGDISEQLTAAGVEGLEQRLRHLEEQQLDQLQRGNAKGDVVPNEDLALGAREIAAVETQIRALQAQMAEELQAVQRQQHELNVATAAATSCPAKVEHAVEQLSERVTAELEMLCGHQQELAKVRSGLHADAPAVANDEPLRAARAEAEVQRLIELVEEESRAVEVQRVELSHAGTTVVDLSQQLQLAIGRLDACESRNSGTNTTVANLSQQLKEAIARLDSCELCSSGAQTTLVGVSQQLQEVTGRIDKCEHRSEGTDASVVGVSQQLHEVIGRLDVCERCAGNTGVDTSLQQQQLQQQHEQQHEQQPVRQVPEQPSTEMIGLAAAESSAVGSAAALETTPLLQQPEVRREVDEVDLASSVPPPAPVTQRSRSPSQSDHGGSYQGNDFDGESGELDESLDESVDPDLP